MDEDPGPKKNPIAGFYNAIVLAARSTRTVMSHYSHQASEANVGFS